MGAWKQSRQGAAIDFQRDMNAVPAAVRWLSPPGWLLGSPGSSREQSGDVGGGTRARALEGGCQRTGRLKRSLGLPPLGLSPAGALLQTTQAHAGVTFTGSAIEREPCGADRRARHALEPLGTHSEGRAGGRALGYRRAFRRLWGKMCMGRDCTECSRSCSVCLRAPGCLGPGSRDAAQKRTPSPIAWFSLP